MINLTNSQSRSRQTVKICQKCHVSTDFSISIETFETGRWCRDKIKISWSSTEAFWNCQDFLDRRDLLFASVKIETLDQVNFRRSNYYFNFWSPANWQNHSISWSKNFLSPVLISWNLISWSPVLQKIPHFTNANDNVTWSKHCSFFLSFFSKFEGRNRRDLALHYGGPQHFVFQKLLVRNYCLGWKHLNFVLRPKIIFCIFWPGLAWPDLT